LFLIAIPKFEKLMGKNRLEAFSDGVIAILITIMVLELKVPHSPDFRALLPLWPVFMSYVLSFIYIKDLLEQAPICELPHHLA
jgi:uncharacterized membrane protein